LLERDNFNKEQQIYQLKCRIEDLEAQLGSAAASSPYPPVRTRPAAPGEAPAEPGHLEPAPAFTHPGPAGSPAQSPEEPLLRITPGEEVPPTQGPNLLRAPGGEAPPRTVPGNSYYWRPSDIRLTAATNPGASAQRVDDNRTVWQVTLHPSLTGGIGDSPSGDQGLLVVVEPRDQAGNIVLAAGQTSVALIDPALAGEQARLARWDFSAAETERAMHAGSESGIHLRLPWRSAPSHDRLKVFVRYTTRDGRKLQAEQTIAVALGAERAESSGRGDVRGRAEPPRAAAAGPWNPDRTGDPSGRQPPLDPQNTPPQRPQWSPDRD
jgi:hypothetical protein